MTLSERVQARAEERRWLILGVLCFSLLVIVLDNSILNVALPSIVRELDATNTQLQWIVDSYTLVFAGLLLTAGSLGDRFGRRPALQVGFALFGLGSLASAMSTTPNMLIFSRAFMGIGGAFIMPATLSIITNVFPTSERGKAIGIWAATAGLGAALGPLTGGFLLEHFYWGSVFLVNLPIVIFGLVAGVFLIAPEFERRALTFRDYVTRLYRGILGRDGESADLDAWEGVLRAHLLGVLDDGFIASPEFQARIPRLCGG